MVFQVEQRGQFFLIEFIHTDRHVMRQNGIEEQLLPGVIKRVLITTLALAARSSRVKVGMAYATGAGGLKNNKKPPEIARRLVSLPARAGGYRLQCRV
jgi:hypothetical protein